MPEAVQGIPARLCIASTGPTRDCRGYGCPVFLAGSMQNRTMTATLHARGTAMRPVGSARPAAIVSNPALFNPLRAHCL